MKPMVLHVLNNVQQLRPEHLQYPTGDYLLIIVPGVGPQLFVHHTRRHAVNDKRQNHDASRIYVDDFFHASRNKEEGEKGSVSDIDRCNAWREAEVSNNMLRISSSAPSPPHFRIPSSSYLPSYPPFSSIPSCPPSALSPSNSHYHPHSQSSSLPAPYLSPLSSLLFTSWDPRLPVDKECKGETDGAAQASEHHNESLFPGEAVSR